MIKIDKVLVGDFGVIFFIIGLLGLLIALVVNAIKYTIKPDIIIALIILTIVGLILIWFESDNSKGM